MQMEQEEGRTEWEGGGQAWALSRPCWQDTGVLQRTWRMRRGSLEGPECQGQKHPFENSSQAWKMASLGSLNLNLNWRLLIRVKHTFLKRSKVSERFREGRGPALRWVVLSI